MQRSSRGTWGAIKAAWTAACGRSPERPWVRAAIAISLFVVIAAIELLFGVFVYFHHWRTTLALALASGGVVMIAALDAWIRPRHEAVGARYTRRWMPHWALVPFLCALASSAWVHYEQWQRSLDDIRELALELSPPSAQTRERAPVPVAQEDPVVGLLARRFAGKLSESDEARRFHELARVIAHDLERARTSRRAASGETPAQIVRRRAQRDTMLDFFLTFGVQALFVLWIPMLLAISIARAIHKLDARASRGPQPGSSLPGDAAQSLRHSLELRDLRILGEDRMYFIPRLCFGTLLVLGTTYVFAPFGLRASYLLSLVDDHALPGHTTFALWSDNFSAAPVIVVGFVGFLIYALITATQRFAQNDLDDQSIFALLVRGLVVMLLSFALSSSSINKEACGLFVFIAGVFPLRALEAIAKRCNVTIDPDFPSDGPGSFEGIPCLDPAKVFALRAAGIESAYDLAAIPIDEIVSRVRLDPHLLGRAVDRAVLIDAVGPDLARALEPFAITSATELVAALPVPASVSDKLGDAPQRAALRLASDDRVVKISRWLAGTPG
ncbi:MAG TPA: hypothetical protein VFK02_04985 [Kofleriaceae bacterium]|nr:hypothetical protein [Kofleriaceae bacterium]